MRRIWVVLVLQVLVHIALCQNDGVIWQGFEHHWQRRAFGLFDTPHRMGSIANYVLSENIDQG
jgi:hypothetical protein